MAYELKLHRFLKRDWTALLRQQHAPRGVLQAENGEGFKLLRVQLHADAELRLLRAVPEIRL